MALLSTRPGRNGQDTATICPSGVREVRQIKGCHCSEYQVQGPLVCLLV